MGGGGGKGEGRKLSRRVTEPSLVGQRLAVQAGVNPPHLLCFAHSPALEYPPGAGPAAP